MEDYPSNSRRAKDGDKSKDKGPVSAKKVEKVVTGEVVRRKKGLGKRFVDSFTGGDDIQTVLERVFFDVVVPGAKDMVMEAGEETLRQKLYGGDSRGARSRGTSVGRTAAQTAYNRFASTTLPRREDPRLSLSRKARARHDFDEIILPTKVEAEEVIDGLFNLVSQYESATVADLYELLGISGNFTDDRWGWTDIRGAGITRVKGGYLLDLPRPEPLD